MMKTNTLKILLSLVAIVIVVLTLHWINASRGASQDGVITIIVINDKKETIIEDDIAYEAQTEDGKKTTIRMILEEHYDIEVRQGMLVRIEDVEADTREYFIKIWINCKQAQYGIDQMPFEDGDIIHFIYTKVGDMSDAC